LDEMVEPRRELGLPRDNEVRRHAGFRVPPPNSWALGCRARRPGWLAAPKFRCQTLPRIDWNPLSPGQLQRLVRPPPDPPGSVLSNYELESALSSSDGSKKTWFA
jgi:hypothetical protein